MQGGGASPSPASGRLTGLRHPSLRGDTPATPPGPLGAFLRRLRPARQPEDQVFFRRPRASLREALEPHLKPPSGLTALTAPPNRGPGLQAGVAQWESA